LLNVDIVSAAGGDFRVYKYTDTVYQLCFRTRVLYLYGVYLSSDWRGNRESNFSDVPWDSRCVCIVLLQHVRGRYGHC